METKVSKRVKFVTIISIIFGLTINIPVIAKGVLQIIASVMLFKSAGELY